MGWLEPLLARVGEDAKHVVTPVIDIINPDSFNYTASPLVRWPGTVISLEKLVICLSCSLEPLTT